MTRMYEVNGKRTPTWNPFFGCKFDCVYCEPSFKHQAKRQKKRCMDCYNFKPHFHPERLKQKFKAGETVFVCSMGDISFATFDQFADICAVIKEHSETTFYVQSKNPGYFLRYLSQHEAIPNNVALGTTIETDKSEYSTRNFSKAPEPLKRILAMDSYWLHDYEKYFTLEPLMNFDLDRLVGWIYNVHPSFVYIGYNNYDSENLHLPEPSLEKTELLIAKLEKFTEVRRKTIRNGWWE